MNRIKEQDAYLFAFFDAVTDYLQNNSSELDGFIRYWDETLCSKTIPSGEIEGIRIFSIHKSKGLEFHTVLLPFCDWKLENEMNNQLVWCAPQEAPFNALDILPINYSTQMAESIYGNDYLHERLQLWVDNLNLSLCSVYPCRKKSNNLEQKRAKRNNVRTISKYSSYGCPQRRNRMGRRLL